MNGVRFFEEEGEGTTKICLYFLSVIETSESLSFKTTPEFLSGRLLHKSFGTVFLDTTTATRLIKVRK